MKRVLSAISLTLAMSAAYAGGLCQALQANPPSISTSIQLNSGGQSSTMNVVLTNHAARSIPAYTLYFNSNYGATAAVGKAFTLIHGENNDQEGDLWGIQSKALSANASVTIPVTIPTNALQDLSFFRGFFIVAQRGVFAPCAPVNITAVNNVMTAYHPALADSDYMHYQQEATTSIEGNTPQAVIDASSIDSVVPKPVSVVSNGQSFQLDLRTVIAINDPALQSDAVYLQQTLRNATGYPLTIISIKSDEVPQDAIVLRYAPLSLQQPEAYSLSVTNSAVVITASKVESTNNPASSEGIFDGIQTLLQLLPPQAFSSTIVSNINWTIPGVSVIDYPRFAYRGFMLDSARHFQPVAEIEHVLQMMALNKLNYFYWHLGDDEGFRFPVNQYPTLTTIGALRGFYDVLQPTLGSGANSYGGFYSAQDIAAILAYAQARHITVIPEIDMPGHARALVKSLPQIEDPNDQSKYVSVQGYTDNVINPCSPQSIETIQNIIIQMAALFPNSPYIGVGGDEVPTGAWMGSPMCKVFMQKNNLQTEQQLFNYFFASAIQPMVDKTGKAVIGWGDLIGSEAYPTPGHPIPAVLPADQTLKTNAVVLPWSVYQNNAQSETDYVQYLTNATNLGYGVVEAPAANMYFDLAYSPNPNEIGQHWAGYTDAIAVYSDRPIPVGFSGNPAKILGVQGNLWGEFDVTQDNLDHFTMPKMAALADVAWTQPQLRDWNDFAYRMTHYYFPILDQMGVQYRISPPGVIVQNGLILANLEFTVPVKQANGSVENENPEFSIHYTTDGSTPTAQSPIFDGSEIYQPGANYQFVTCNPMGRCSYAVTPVVAN